MAMSQKLWHLFGTTVLYWRLFEGFNQEPVCEATRIPRPQSGDGCGASSSFQRVWPFFKVGNSSVFLNVLLGISWWTGCYKLKFFIQFFCVEWFLSLPNIYWLNHWWKTWKQVCLFVLFIDFHDTFIPAGHFQRPAGLHSQS